jgi:hypothetical protein
MSDPYINNFYDRLDDLSERYEDSSFVQMVGVGSIGAMLCAALIFTPEAKPDTDKGEEAATGGSRISITVNGHSYNSEDGKVNVVMNGRTYNASDNFSAVSCDDAHARLRHLVDSTINHDERTKGYIDLKALRNVTDKLSLEFNEGVSVRAVFDRADRRLEISTGVRSGGARHARVDYLNLSGRKVRD